MKRYKIVEVTNKEEQFVRMTCDICGKSTKYEEWQNDSNRKTEEFHNSIYFDTEIKVEYKYGINYPNNDGGHGYTYDLNVCPECFKNRIIPLLKTNKKPKKWDY